MEIVRIPEARVKNLIGIDGKTKKLLEDKCNVKIEVDNEGEVQIEGEIADEFFAKDVVRAIGRGFEPNTALKILDDNYQFELIDLKDILKNEKAIKRVKARIIGEKGKMKTEIEDATDSNVSVYGFTVSVISQHDTIQYATEAITKIINGSEHSRVFGYLAKAKKEILRLRLT
jgi:ribosomal RNA assembly protein